MLITVVLCTHNGARLIGRQIDALASQQLDGLWEILIVDNDSTDETPGLIADAATRHDRVRGIQAREQHNLAYARNVAARSSTADFLVFVDDDDIAGDGWLTGIAHALRSSELVGSRLEYSLLNPPEALIGRSRFQSVELGRFCGRPVVMGAGHGVSRALFERLGGNDESWSFSGEDFDFSLRAAEAGVVPAISASGDYHYQLRTGFRPTFRQARSTGRAHVALHRRFGGTETPNRAAGSLWWIATRAPLAAAGVRRDLWARRIGLRIGRTEQRARQLIGQRVGNTPAVPTGTESRTSEGETRPRLGG